MEERLLAYCELLSSLINHSTPASEVNGLLEQATSTLTIDEVNIQDRVQISTYALNLLSHEQRKQLAKILIEEQIVKQRKMLSHWGTLTAQSFIIDTGYIAQHLVSLQTQISGQGMRGKGDDLCDGAEVKSANFIGSLDKKGKTAPRWDFSATNVAKMEQFLNYSMLYLTSMDLSPENNCRIRIWKLDLNTHPILRNRYIEWMNVKGYPKFNDKANRHDVNFQLFPPRNKTNETFARHGSTRHGELPPIQIPLENITGSELIFKAEVINDEVVISVF